MQLSLYPTLNPDPPKRRKPYRTTDMKIIEEEYTKGWLKGPEIAKKLDRTHGSFRQFLLKHPHLRKGR